MDPGPASIGIAKGVKAISFLSWASVSVFLLIPLFFENCPESKENPEPTIIIPPAILRASMLIPKKESTYCPTKNETIRIINTFIAVHNEILERSFFVSDCVSPTKMGTVPIGFNTENSAANR
jgi:hypothetical protein